MNHLALILHAHLPFVRHPEHEHFLEEDWFFEAITETYIPLLQMMQRLVNDNVPFKLTMSLTPTLCAMIQDPLLRERYIRQLDLLIDLAARERKRNQDEAELAELLECEQFKSHWLRSSQAVLSRDLHEAAEICGRTGFRALQAFFRLRSGSPEAVRRALDFYRRVGATRYIREGEAMLAVKA